MFTELKISKKAMDHIAKKRQGLSKGIIQEAFRDDYKLIRNADRGRKIILGDGGNGNLLTIIAEPEETKLRMITCRGMNENEKAEYQRNRKRRSGY